MKKIISFYLLICFVVFSYGTRQTMAKENTKPQNTVETAGKAAEAEVVSIQSQSACLMEFTTGTVLYEKNADVMLRPASVTKVMTLLLIFESLDAGTLTYDDIVTVSEHAASMGGSQCFFEAGEQQTVRDMIKCIEVASGNDAAVAMAEHIGGSEDAFVLQMNSRAKELGMENTHFENACGLEAEGHLTTARDIAIMSRELLLKHPEIKDYSTIWMDSIVHKTRRGESRFDLANTNKFLNQYQGATGLKTGYTSQAKYCISASAERNGIELISVIMGAETKDIRNKEAGRLLDYGFSRCKLYTDNEILPENVVFPVECGISRVVSCETENSFSFVLVDCEPNAIEKQIIPYEPIAAPIQKGDIIGAVQYIFQGNVLAETYIHASEDVAELSYPGCIHILFQKLFMMTVDEV